MQKGHIYSVRTEQRITLFDLSRECEHQATQSFHCSVHVQMEWSYGSMIPPMLTHVSHKFYYGTEIGGGMLSINSKNSD